MRIDELLRQAREMKASDLHVSVGIPPKCRVNGELVALPCGIIMPNDSKALVEQMIPPRMIEKFNEDGEIDFSYAARNLGRFRVNVFKQRGALSFVIRLVNSKIPSPEQLGLSKEIVDLTKKKRGLVLVTGPTGSGKSTTLASMIDVINQNYNKHIITLEDPIEYLHADKQSIISQREIAIDTKNYLTGLRACLRQAPDVILLGEMRDAETIRTAMTAAETGHLVIATLHTKGAVNTIDRIVDSFPADQQDQIKIQLSLVLDSIVSQQLLHKGEGGMIPAFEVMKNTPAIRNLIRDSKNYQIDNIIQTSGSQGMISMDQYILNLYQKGLISGETALQGAVNPEQMARKTGTK